MSDHEPSYYEIALTNRQVVIAFAILLVCLVAAFLAGVWVGRGDGAPPPVRLAQEAPAEAPDDAEGEPLSFFGGDSGAAGAGEPAAEPGAVEPAAEPGAGSTLAEDLGEDIDAPETEPTPATTAEPAPADPAPAAPARPTTAPARPPAAAREPAAAAPAAGEVVIQVLSSRDREQAQSMVERLLAGGRDAYLSPVETGGQTMYRVRIGPFADRAQAQRVADEVRRQFRVDTWITPR